MYRIELMPDDLGLLDTVTPYCGTNKKDVSTVTNFLLTIDNHGQSILSNQLILL